MRRLFSEDSEVLLFKSLNYIPIPVLLSEALTLKDVAQALIGCIDL